MKYAKQEQLSSSGFLRTARRIIYSAILLCVAQVSSAQQAHKLNLDMDGSFALHYFSKEHKNPVSYGGSLGYQYDFNYFLAVGMGFKLGGFYQDAGRNNSEEAISREIYKGMNWGAYIAPKILIPVGFSDKFGRAHYVYLENKFSYMRNQLSLDKLSGENGNTYANTFNYELKLGYQYALSSRWAMNTWVGYNTFDIGRISSHVKYKNTTPMEIGVGFSYILSKQEKY